MTQNVDSTNSERGFVPRLDWEQLQDGFDEAMHESDSGTGEAALIYTQQAQAYALRMQAMVLDALYDLVKGHLDARD